jgi:Fibronectin type III domain.
LLLDKPFAPTNFTQLDSPDATSIRISWLEIPNNRTGEDFDGYRVFYYMNGMREITNRSRTNLPRLPNRQPNYDRVNNNGETFLLYTITGLNPSRQYHVWVLGYNNKGDGDTTPRLLLSPGVNRKFICNIMFPQ